jgi:uncharacterized membrane protein
VATRRWSASSHIWDQLTDDRQPGSPVWRPEYEGGTRVQFGNRPADLERPDAGWRHLGSCGAPSLGPVVTGLQEVSDLIAGFSAASSHVPGNGHLRR